VNDKGDRIRKIVQKIGNDESYTTLRVFVRWERNVFLIQLLWAPFVFFFSFKTLNIHDNEFD
jgi:hypothetical protein